MIRGIIFDLDGTLTAPGLIDFAAMRRAIGCPEGQTILEHLEELRARDPAGWRRAFDEVSEREREAALRVEPAANLEPFLAWLETTGLPRAIFTRNSRASALLTLELLGLTDRFDPVVAREDAPPKPAPDGIHLITRRWGIRPSEALVVGDFRHDIEAGARAGARTVLYSGGRVVEQLLTADHRIDDLLELADVLARLQAQTSL